MLVRVNFFKRNTANGLRSSDWRSDVCSSDLDPAGLFVERVQPLGRLQVFEERRDGLGILGAAGNADALGIQDRLARQLALAEAIGRASWRERGCQYV